MSRKRPITIKRGTFVCTLYDAGNLMELPLANLRKLWKLMFSEAWENRETIQMIRDWLPVNVEWRKERLTSREGLLVCERENTENERRTVAVFGSVATKEQKAAHAAARREHKAAERADRAAKAARVKAEKLQTIFNEMSKN
jgi:hypothetical protein